MRTTAALLAVLLMSATGIAIAQEQQGPGAGSPAIERGGPSVGGAGEGPGPGGPASEGRAAEPGPGPNANAPNAGEERQAVPRSEPQPGKRNAYGKDRDEGRSARSEDTSRQRRGSGRDEEKSLKRATEQDADEGADKSRADSKADRGDTPSEATKRTEESEGASSEKRAGNKPAPADNAKSVNLSEDKKGRLRDAFHDVKDAKPRKDVDIDITIGRRLPRDWHFHPIPIAVIDIVPEYRDYVFVYVDDEYVICDPVTYEVVAVIPAGGARHAGGGSATDDCPARLTLSRNERELILDSIRLEREIDVGNLEVGWSVPADIELLHFPDEVISEADELGACRYFVSRDQLAIVDPREEKVVLVIDKG
jgi:hypothetical protein